VKPWQNEKLLATISAAMTLKESRNEEERVTYQQKQLPSDLDSPFKGFVGRSALMRSVFDNIARVAVTDANVLSLGENGTGKELVARELHRQSPRRDEVFISVDMGALNDSLFESELFGHVKGAFTDAREHRAGRFEVASGGTLFLDEIGNLPMALQAKLLTVIQNREVTRLGANLPRRIDIRLICASNMPLQEMASAKEFREDLFYRIRTVEIHLPPLRERAEDILPLTDHFLSLYCTKYKKPLKEVSAASRKLLASYRWPGNVRELQYAVERAVIMSDAPVLHPNDFLLGKGPTPKAGKQQDLNLEEVERETIRKALAKHDGNITHTAKELGLTRTALYRRLEKYGL